MELHRCCRHCGCDNFHITPSGHIFCVLCSRSYKIEPTVNRQEIKRIVSFSDGRVVEEIYDLEKFDVTFDSETQITRIAGWGHVRDEPADVS